MSRRCVAVAAWLMLAVSTVQADDVLHRYEGDVLPYDESAGWIVPNACEGACTDALEDGRYVARWFDMATGDNFYYHHWIARAPEAPPPTLWVEWQFRSNHPFGWGFCDGSFTVDYADIHDMLFLYGDGVISHSGDHYVTGLALDEFHTYRFESLDGTNYRFSVDGFVIKEWAEDQGNDVDFVQFGGTGGCLGCPVTSIANEWDFIRYGSLASGEEIGASDPPCGELDRYLHADLDRFTVTFVDAHGEPIANYVYVDDITVEVSVGDAPVVVQTRRLDGGAPETVEIVLDRPLAVDAVTTFTFDDGANVNVVEYSYAAPGFCGDDIVNRPDEECDGTDDAACPGWCHDDCTCPIPEIPEIPTLSTWSLVVLALVLLTVAKLTARRRRAASLGKP